jgi:hypothetical protein
LNAGGPDAGVRQDGVYGGPGFHSRASRCAVSICAAVMSFARPFDCRPLTPLHGELRVFGHALALACIKLSLD